ncbi:Ig-like domain-containing protein [Providencia vermicola]|uniref:Ig-like domain-containing protein n=1 Tax=Providencia vermicola TaxID=333965 RepID=UPI0032DB5E6F
MESINNSSDKKDIVIKSFKVQGLDLIVIKPDGTSSKIPNGLSDIILGNITLTNENGNSISQDEIISSIKMNIGVDSVYIKEQFSSDFVKINDNEKIEDDIENDSQKFIEKLDALNKKNEELAEIVSGLELINENQEAQINASLAKLAEANSQLEQQAKAKAQAADKQEEAATQPSVSPSLQPAPPSSSVSTSSSASKPKDNNAAILPPSTVYISGKLSEESDSGKAGDHITQNNTPTFTGTVSLDSNAYLMIGGTRYPITADNNGNWVLQITPPLKDGVHDYELGASRGNEAPILVKGQLTIDTALNTLTADIDVHADSGTLGDKLTHHSQPTFTGVSEAGSTVVLTIDKQVLTTVADEKGIWRVTVGNLLQDDQYTYHVTATDAAGNQNTTTNTLTIKTTAPEITATLDGGNGFLTNQTQPMLMGKTEAGLTVKVSIDGQEYSAQADDQGNWSLQILQGLPDGNHLFSVKVMDAAGNQSTVTDSIVVDTRKPSATAKLTSESDSGKEGDNITRDPQPVLTGSTKPDSAIRIIFDGNSYPVTTEADGSWHLTLPTLTQDGNYDYQVHVTDLAGNESSFNGFFTLDTTVENVTVGLDTQTDSGAVGDKLTNNKQPIFSGSAEANSKITLNIAGQILTTVADENGVWDISVKQPLPEGLSKYQVTAVDAAGNQKTVEDTVIIKTSLPNATTILEGGHGFLTNQTTPTLSGKTEANATIKVTIGKHEYSSKADENGDWSLQISDALTDGSHLLTVKVTDNVGNQSVFMENVQIDTVPPSADAGIKAESDTGLIGDNITQKIQPFICGVTKPYSTVIINLPGYAGGTRERIADENGYWEVRPTVPQSDNTSTYTVTVTDLAGNTSSYQGQYTIDTQIALTVDLDPASQSDTVFDGQTTHLARPQISGTSDPGAKITGQFKDTTKIVYADQDGKWSLVFDVDANTDTGNTYTITASDIAGNEKTITKDFNFLPILVGAERSPELTAKLHIDSDSGIQGDNITNVNTPKFEGIATAGASITLNINGVDYPATADMTTGEWTVTTKPLPEGNNSYVVTATHPDYSKPTEVHGHTFVDTISPSSIITLTLETDSGTQGNFITSNRNPVFTGKSEVGCTVTLTLNNQTVSMLTDSNGEWSLTLPNELPESFSGRFEVSITDVAGNLYTEEGQLVIDNTMPVLSDIKFTSPYNNYYSTWYSNDKTPTFTGKVSPGSSLEFSFDMAFNSKTYPQHFTITDIDENGNWSFTLPEGMIQGNTNYYYRINNMEFKATSPSGVETTEKFHPSGIHIKDAAVTITGGVAAQSSSTGSEDQHLTFSRNPVLQGSVTDGEKMSGYIDIGNKQYKLSFSSDSKKWYVVLPSDTQLLLGENNYTLTMTDIYGSKFEYSSYVTVSDFKYWLDPDCDSGKLGDHVTNTTKPVYKGIAEIGAKLSVKVNGVLYLIDVDNNGEWSFEVPITGNGDYQIEFIQANNGVIVAKNTLTIDTIAPEYIDGSVYSGNAHPGTLVANNNEFHIFLNYKTPVDYYTIEINNQTITHNRVEKPFDGNSTQIGGVLKLPNGVHHGKVIAYDKAGNILEHEIIIPVLAGDQAINPPKISVGLHDKLLISESDKHVAFNNNTLKLIGTTTPGSNIEVMDAQGHLLGTTQANNDGVWELQLSESLIPIGILHDESIQLVVNVKDLLDRESQLNFNLTYDNQPPEITGAVDDVLLEDIQQININTPTFSGETEAYADVKLTIGPHVFTTTAGSDGKWHYTIPPETPLDDGSYLYKIEATDVLGQVSTQKVNGNLIVKTTAFISGGLDPNEDSGIQDDGITHFNKPKFEGITEPNAIVRLIFDNKIAFAYETIADEQGQWVIEVTSKLEDGPHDYVITTKDLQQGISGQISGKLTIDTIAPEGLIGGVVDHQDLMIKDHILTNNTTPTFSGFAEPGANLQLMFGQSVFALIEVDKQGQWTYTFPQPFPDGEYEYTIIMEDIAGNLSSTGLTGKVVIDTTPPLLTLDIAGVDANNGKNQITTNHKKPVFSGTSEEYVKIVLMIDGKSYKEATVDASGKWEIAVTDEWEDKAYQYEVIAVDGSGNEVKNSGTITVDTVAPTLVDSGAVNPNTLKTEESIVTNSSTPTFKGSSEAGSVITVEIGGNLYDNIPTNEKGEWSFTVPPSVLKDGLHKYTITATDVAGNQSASQKGTITVDTVAPTLVDSGAVNPNTLKTEESIVTNSSTPTFKGSSEAGSVITVEIGGNLYDNIPTNEKGEWSFTVPPAVLQDGLHKYTITATDVAGNQSAPQKGQITVDTVAPTLVDSGAVNPNTLKAEESIVTNSSAPTFKGSSEAGSVIRIDIGGSSFKDIPTNEKGEWSFTVPPAVLQDGLHKYTITATDVAGNQSAPQKGQITVDTVAPTLVDSGAVNPNTLKAEESIVTNSSAPTFKGSSEAGSVITVEIGGNSYKDIQVNGKGEWSFTVPPSVLKDGLHKYTITATDVAGNQSAPQKGQITVDTVAPTLVDSGAVNPNTLKTEESIVTNSSTPTFKGSSEAGSVITVEIGGNLYDNIPTNEKGEWSFTVPPAVLQDGLHKYTITATDVAGNQSAPQKGTITVDTLNSSLPPTKSNELTSAFMQLPEVDNNLSTEDIHF